MARRAAGPTWWTRSWTCRKCRKAAGLEAAVPLGDSEALARLRERTEDTVTHPAGSTALLDGTIPDGGHEPGTGPAGSGPPEP